MNLDRSSQIRCFVAQSTSLPISIMHAHNSRKLALVSRGCRFGVCWVGRGWAVWDRVGYCSGTGLQGYYVVDYSMRGYAKWLGYIVYRGRDRVPVFQVTALFTERSQCLLFEPRAR